MHNFLRAKITAFNGVCLPLHENLFLMSLENFGAWTEVSFSSPGGQKFQHFQRTAALSRHIGSHSLKNKH